MNYWRNLFLGGDQFFNALRGGFHDNTISAECGYHSMTTADKYWRFLEWFINWAFKPIDGKGHCLMAYEDDPNERFVEGSALSKVGLALILLFWVPPIALVIRIYKRFQNEL